MADKKPKKLFYYGRRPMPLKPEQFAKLRPNLPLTVDFIAVELALENLDGKSYVSTTFCGRIISHLYVDLGVSRDEAELLVALRMDHPDVKSLKKSMRTEEYHLAKLKAAADHQRLMKAQGHVKVLLSKSRGRLLDLGYFFNNHVEYLHMLEALLLDHNDDHLQNAVNQYPQKMEWVEYHLSFGQFWQKALREQLMGKIDFTEPGVESVKRLAHCLFTWNFRRYLHTDVISRHACFLPRLYRHLHIAARRDADPVNEVDGEYEQESFEEERGDNIGNH